MKPSLRMMTRAALPLTALGLIGFAVLAAQRDDAGAQQTPVVDPSRPPERFGAVVAALGVVEPNSEVIAVAADLPGVVRAVWVRPGDAVEAGAPLFRLDSRSLDAQIASAEAAVALADVEARDAAARLGLYADAGDTPAISTDERDRARFAADRAQAALALARADLNRLETDRARLTVRAPISGEILAVNIHVGEYAAPGPLEDPLIAMGDTQPLHVRVQIDEEDAARIAAGAAAEGSLRGAGAVAAPLAFVRFEPQAVPKQNLNGGAERVDTRVVEAIYAMERDALPAFVGQQMDVYVQAAPFGQAARAP
ncbi:MAG: efflux RND transporter periplasmic adaptor subunit [Alphaproteobacteria bacterium]|jgi:HlyD family secretion protein|nr:efflux RND transporter periplasmic adaptor subunit [Alphaproteobacteria bacterium]